ncbi:MAG: site-specific integrase [Pseudomonadales bacterium]
MLNTYFKYGAVLKRLRAGPLADAMDDIADGFTLEGYAQLSAVRYLSLLGSFNRYIQVAGCTTPEAISEELMARFLKEFPRTESTRILVKTALAHLSRYLDCTYPARIQPSINSNPDAPFLSNFDAHLRDIRGLQTSSRRELLRLARRMLNWYRIYRPHQTLSQLSGKDVLAFVAVASQQCVADTTRSDMVSHVRNFLRYLHWEGILDEDLAPMVPRTPCWRMSRIPEHLAWDDVQQVINSIDASTAIGMRDRAILLLLATTGLRSQELRRLQLQDVCWRTSEVYIRTTKSRRDHRVPLLEEAGSALAEYVLQGRPQTANTTIFLCHRPPVRPIRDSSTLAAIVRRHLAHCSIHAERAGAHLLRHSLATRMVQQSRPIKDIADLLGHRHIDTTAIYIKVALPQLSGVALPFPGGQS